jgi:hypothetical protein
MEPKSVRFELTFFLMANETATCVILHDLLHRIRKWQLHMWNFMTLGNSMY